MKEVKINEGMHKAVQEFCYLVDMLSARGGCELAVVKHCKCSWEKFCQLLPHPINCNLLVLTDNMRERCDAARSRQWLH